MKPIIGINLDIRSEPHPETFIYTNYLEAIKQSGAVPLLLAPMPDEDLQQVLPHLNGLMLIGGDDYSPAKYGQAAQAKIDPINSVREDFDFRLIKKALDAQMPLLGICTGCQLLNIHLGGTLIQDIESQCPSSTVVHKSEDGWRRGWNKHNITIKKNSHLAKLYEQETVSVVTNHHQGLDKLGKDLVASAHADDGMIEALELAGRTFVIGVVWHPERDFAANKKLFEHFVEEARKNMQKSSTDPQMLSCC